MLVPLSIMVRRRGLSPSKLYDWEPSPGASVRKDMLELRWGSPLVSRSVGEEENMEENVEGGVEAREREIDPWLRGREEGVDELWGGVWEGGRGGACVEKEELTNRSPDPQYSAA